MRFSRSAPAALIAAVVVVVVSLTAASNLLFGGMTTSVEQSQFELMRSIVAFNLEGAATNALARAEILASSPTLREALANEDRPRVLAETEAMFAEQREKYGVDQVQFHLAPATSFLRLQAPETYGDDLTNFRPIVVAVNRERVARKGVAIARTGPGIFGVAPMFAPSGEHIGSVEFGIAFGSVLDRLKAAYGLDLTLFIDEDPLTRFATGIAPGVITDENRVGRTIKIHSTNWALMQSLVQETDLRSRADEVRYTRAADGQTYGVLLFPIRNGSGAVIGTLAVARSFEGTRGPGSRSVVIQILMAIFAIVLLTGVILIVVRGFLLRPLAAMTDRFRTLGTAEPAPEPDPDDARLCREIADLASEQERLRAAMSPPPRGRKP